MEVPHNPYVHGRSAKESERLHYQASRLADLLHGDTRYPPGTRVLEAACGVGAQTLILAKNSPGAEFLSVDIAPESLALAEKRIRAEGVSNVTFRQGDIYHLPFRKESFDHVFVCFLLEHLEKPLLALENMRVLLSVNPLARLMRLYRCCLFDGYLPVIDLLVVAAVAVFLFYIGYRVITRLKPILTDYV